MTTGPVGKERYNENSDHLYRRGLQRQPRPRGLGGGAALWRPPPGALRRRGPDYKQPHGAHRGDLRPVPFEGALRGGAVVRLQVCHRRLVQGLGQGLEGPGLGQERQKARPEPGPVGRAAAIDGDPHPPLPLGQRARRHRGEQPLRRAGGHGEPEVQRTGPGPAAPFGASKRSGPEDRSLAVPRLYCGTGDKKHISFHVLWKNPAKKEGEP